MFNEIKERAVNLAADRYIYRLLRNLGVLEIIDNPKKYRLEFYVDKDDELTLKVRPNKRES